MNTRTVFGRRIGIAAVCALAVFQSLMRFAIAGSILMGSIDAWDEVLTVPISNEMMLFLNITFLVIGAAGIITAAGLWSYRRWGFNGTIWLSIVTIVFDVWAMFTFQMSAAMGLMLPVIFIVYLMLTKKSYMMEVERHEGSRGVRN